MQEDTKRHLADRNIWVRGLYMLFYALAYAVAEALATLLVLFQFIHTLFTGRVNEQLQQFGANLAAYLYEILQYVTFNSEFQPFPFSDWPSTATGNTPWSMDARAEPADYAAVDADEPTNATPPPTVDDDNKAQ